MIDPDGLSADTSKITTTINLLGIEITSTRVKVLPAVEGFWSRLWYSSANGGRDAQYNGYTVVADADGWAFTTPKPLTGTPPIPSFAKIGKVFKALRVTSSVKKDAKILKLAQEAFKGNDKLRKEANALIKQLQNGNLNPGIGTKNIGKAYLRLGAQVELGSILKMLKME